MEKIVTNTGLKSMIGIEIIKAERKVDFSVTADVYQQKIKEYKRAKRLKQLLKEFDKGQEYITKEFEQLSGREITL
ncbi:hypothetical protein CYL18_07640 [Pradoshia eiseniae]|uniref:Uncharacterized protein n=1 Tax=Pradoshia eiseniae TaxID=2064768 RepID=A0A2S7N1A0_9BACI|nr:hypothetical protein [Pradoshia eiseniae]PQD95755.1 hypothetical protein CYL18_07640 [Pradoshia eiseniae]